MVNIGIIQMSADPLNVPANLSKAEQYIARAAQDGADIAVLPEMFSVGFSTSENLARLSENLDGRTVTWLKDQAERHRIYIIFVEPPFMFKLYQKLCFTGFEARYETMRLKHLGA